MNTIGRRSFPLTNGRITFLNGAQNWNPLTLDCGGRYRPIALGLLLLFGAGCAKPVEETTDTGESWDPVPANLEPQTSEEPFDNRMITADEMRQLLGANEQAQFEKSGRNFVAAYLANSGAQSLDPLAGQPLRVLQISETEISDLSALRGMPLEQVAMMDAPVTDLSPLAECGSITHLYLEQTQVSDLTPLKALPLKALYLNGCPVTDLSPLVGKQLDELNLCDTQVESLEPFAEMELGIVWLRNTAVTDLSPLSGRSVVSLDIQGSQISDLSPLANVSTLERLNIAETPVTDLTPLAALPLTRLIFSPEKIESGIDVIRAMASLREIDTEFEGQAAMSPAEFWERFDSGAFLPESK